MSNTEINQAIQSTRKLLASEKGLSPAFKSAKEIMFIAVSILLDRLSLNSGNSSKLTPLLLASITVSASNKPAIVQLLLERGAKIDVQDDQGNTPLSFAEKLNSEVYKILKEAKKRRTANERK